MHLVVEQFLAAPLLGSSCERDACGWEDVHPRGEGKGPFSFSFQPSCHWILIFPWPGGSLRGRCYVPPSLLCLKSVLAQTRVLPENQNQQDTGDAQGGFLLPQEKPVYLFKTFQLIGRGPHWLLMIISFTQSQLIVDVSHIYKIPSNSTQIGVSSYN